MAVAYNDDSFATSPGKSDDLLDFRDRCWLEVILWTRVECVGPCMMKVSLRRAERHIPAQLCELELKLGVQAGLRRHGGGRVFVTLNSS